MAIPDFSKQVEWKGIRLVGDSVNPSLAYLLPSSLELVNLSALDTNEVIAGAELFLTRYTGSSVHGDSGERFLRSLLRFRVRVGLAEPMLLREAELHFAKQLGVPEIHVRPIPITKTDTVIVIEDLEGELDNELRGGFFDADQQRNQNSFMEREFILPLAPTTAEAFSEAIDQGGLVASLSYSLWTDALSSESIDSTADTSVELELTAPKAEKQIALNDTLPIPVISVKKFDLDLGAPANYPSLRVYCFDFSDALRSDLFSKEIEFSAIGVSGGFTSHVVQFSADEPQVSTRAVRFPFAVDISKPYRYRVTEILLDGQVQQGEWKKRENWASIVNVTSLNSETESPSHFESPTNMQSDEETLQ